MSWEDYGPWGATIKTYLSEWMCEGNKELREDISCREETEREREREKQMVSREFASGEVLSGCSIMKKYTSRPSQLLMHRQCHEKDKARQCWTQNQFLTDTCWLPLFPRTSFLSDSMCSAPASGLWFFGSCTKSLLLNPTCQSHVYSQRPLPVSKCFKITLPGTAHDCTTLPQAKTFMQGLLLTSVGCSRERLEDRPLETARNIHLGHGLHWIPFSTNVKQLFSPWIIWIILFCLRHFKKLSFETSSMLELRRESLWTLFTRICSCEVVLPLFKILPFPSLAS